MSRRAFHIHFDGEPDRFSRMQQLFVREERPTVWQRITAAGERASAQLLALGAVVVIVGLFSALWLGWKCGVLWRREEWEVE